MRKRVDGMMSARGDRVGATHASPLLLAAAIIVIATAAVYMPAMKGGFIWDDSSMVSENPLIRSSGGLWDFWFSKKPTDYWPLTNSSLWIEWRIWGTNTTGYHVTNVALHAASAVLLWLVLRRLAIPGAWLAALIFAVHPVNAASVAWISERKNTLSLALYFIAILTYMTFDGGGRRRWYIVSLAASLLALLSKTSVVMLPLVLLGCVWWKRRKVVPNDLARVVPFFILSLGLGLVTVWFQGHRAIAAENIEFGGVASRIAGAGWAVWFYLWKAVLPAGLSAIYPLSNIDVRSALAFVPDALLVAVFALLMVYRRTWGRPLLFGLGYFVVTIAPVLGFFKMYFTRYSLVADHWQYVSIIGIIALTVGLGAWACHRGGLAVVLAALLVVALGALTFAQNRIYANEEVFWRSAARRNPSAWAPQDWLGVIHQRKGFYELAMGCHSTAMRLDPTVAQVHSNMGGALFHVGRVDESIDEFETALRLDPLDARYHNNLAGALAAKGRVDDAVAHYREALRLDPGYTSARRRLGLALEQLERYDESANGDGRKTR